MPKKSLKASRVDERTDRHGKAVSNRILLDLPESEYRVIRPALEFLVVPRGKTLYEPNQAIESVYFPQPGVNFSGYHHERRQNRGSGGSR